MRGCRPRFRFQRNQQMSILCFHSLFSHLFICYATRLCFWTFSPAIPDFRTIEVEKHFFATNYTRCGFFYPRNHVTSLAFSDRDCGRKSGNQMSFVTMENCTLVSLNFSRFFRVNSYLGPALVRKKSNCVVGNRRKSDGMPGQKVVWWGKISANIRLRNAPNSGHFSLKASPSKKQPFDYLVKPFWSSWNANVYKRKAPQFSEGQFLEMEKILELQKSL